MKKTVWKPTKEELEEMGFGEDGKIEMTEEMGVVCRHKGGFGVYYNDLRHGCYNTEFLEIFPRSKEELQDFIYMFEEDETTTLGNSQ